MNGACMVDAGHHSDDTIEVYHGLAEPAIACGFHALHFPEDVFTAHRNMMKGVLA